MMKAKIIIGLVMVLVLSGIGFSQATEEKITKRAKNQITGEVSGISKDSISVVYRKEEAQGVEYEMLLPIEQGIKLERLKDLSQINIGDTVLVEYEDVSTLDVEGKEFTKRKAKLIKFIRPAPQAIPEVGVSEEELISTETEGY